MSNESHDHPVEDNVDANIDDNLEQTADEASANADNIDADVEIDGETGPIAALQEEVGVLKDQVLRAQADTQNARRRAEQDVEKARKFALEKFVNDLLPVADNLERAITSIDEDSEAQKTVLEGVELTLKSLQDTLKKYHVEAIDPEGEPFDPQLHQAMSMVPNPDVEANTVLTVFQKGYTLNGRLVRPAMVVVSTA